jgi:hypothetical protein
LVVCDYLLQEVAKEIVISQVPNGVIGDGENVRDDIINRRVTCTIWCKMIRRSLFLENDIVWPANMSHEDMVMSDMAAYYARRIAHVPIPFYHYVYRSSSVSNTIEPESVEKNWSCIRTTSELLRNSLKEKVSQRSMQKGY